MLNYRKQYFFSARRENCLAASYKSTADIHRDWYTARLLITTVMHTHTQAQNKSRKKKRWEKEEEETEEEENRRGSVWRWSVTEIASGLSDVEVSLKSPRVCLTFKCHWNRRGSVWRWSVAEIASGLSDVEVSLKSPRVCLTLKCPWNHLCARMLLLGIDRAVMTLVTGRQSYGDFGDWSTELWWLW